MTEKDDFQLGESSREVLGNLVDVLIHRAAEMEDKPALEEVVDELEKFIGGMPTVQRFGILSLVRLFEMGPLTQGFKHQFTNLPFEEQTRFVREFESHSNYAARAMMLGLKAVITIVYFSHPAVEKAIGYEHTCLLEARKAKGN